MIKATINKKDSDDEKIILLGITELNIEKLKNNKPIKVLGKDIGTKHDIYIIYGKNEMHLMKMLQPMINDETKFK